MGPPPAAWPASLRLASRPREILARISDRVPCIHFANQSPPSFDRGDSLIFAVYRRFLRRQKSGISATIKDRSARAIPANNKRAGRLRIGPGTDLGAGEKIRSTMRTNFRRKIYHRFDRFFTIRSLFTSNRTASHNCSSPISARTTESSGKSIRTITADLPPESDP